MGFTHIVTVYEDGIRDAKNGDWESYAQAVGEAVLTVSIAPQQMSTENGLETVKNHAVFNYGNCVTHVDKRHSGDDAIYLWATNCLRPISALETADLRQMLRNIEAEIAKREGTPEDS